MEKAITNVCVFAVISVALNCYECMARAGDDTRCCQGTTNSVGCIDPQNSCGIVTYYLVSPGRKPNIES